MEPTPQISLSPRALREAPEPLQVGADAAARRRSYLYMIISVLCFVANGLSIRWAGGMPGADTWIATSCRYLVGLAMVAAIYLPRRQVDVRALFLNRLMITRGLLGGGAIYCFYHTIPAIGAGRATVINCTYILFAAVLAGPLLGEKLSLTRFLWFLAGCFGIGLLCLRAGTGESIGWMDVLALLGAVLAAGVVVTIRQLSGSQHFSTIFTSQCLYGLVLAAVPALMSQASPAPQTWAVMLAGGVFAGAGQLCMTRAYRDLSVANGAAVQMLLPVLTAIGGFLLFQEHYAILEILGGILVLVACWRVLTAR